MELRLAVIDELLAFDDNRPDCTARAAFHAQIATAARYGLYDTCLTGSAVNAYDIADRAELHAQLASDAELAVDPHALAGDEMPPLRSVPHALHLPQAV